MALHRDWQPVQNSFIELYMDPARAQATLFEMRRTRLQSYIRPVCRRQIDTLAMMDFRAFHAASRSSGLIGHDSKCRVVKRRSDRFPVIIEQCTYATLVRTFLRYSVFNQHQFCGPRSPN